MKKDEGSDYEGKDIIICMLQSIVQKTYPLPFYSSVGLVVVDECHHIAARTFSRIFTHFPAAHRLGLTATPYRKDGLEHVIHWLLGPTVCRVTRKDSSKSVLVEIVKHNPTTWKEIRTNQGKILFTKMITKLVEDETRNQLIARKIEALKNEGRRRA